MDSTADTSIRIDMTPPTGEEGRVDAIMEPYREMLGRAPGGMRMLGVSPPLLEHYSATILYYMQHSRLGQPLLTFLRYLVSWRGDCEYCINLNETFLLGAGMDLDGIRAARDNPMLTPLSDREKALLLVALDAVDHPESITAERLNVLRALEWSDRDILDAVWHATSTRAFGRTAECFGLPRDSFGH